MCPWRRGYQAGEGGAFAHSHQPGRGVTGFSYRFSRRAQRILITFIMICTSPFVTSRHGRLASVSTLRPTQDLLLRWGGLLLITRNGEPVAGSVCYFVGDVFYGVEEGILDNDADLIHSGINAYIYWCSYQWAVQNQARMFNMGPSYPAVGDGPFDFKAHWGTRVVRRRRLISYWEVSSGDLTEDAAPAAEQPGMRYRAGGGVLSGVGHRFGPGTRRPPPRTIAW